MIVNVTQTVIPDRWQYGGTTGILRVHCTLLMLDADTAEFVLPSTPEDESSKESLYLNIPFTIAGKTITIPAFNLHSTTNSNKPLAYYVFALHDSNGKFRDILFYKIRVPTSFGAEATLPELYTYSQTTPEPLGDTFYTADEINALLRLMMIVGIVTGDKGDISVSNDGSEWTINNDVVTIDHLAPQYPANSFLARSEGVGLGKPDTVVFDTDIFDILGGVFTFIANIAGMIEAGSITPDKLEYLNQGEFLGRASSGPGFVEFLTLDGEVFMLDGGVFRLQDDAVSFGKIENIAQNKILGRFSPLTGDIEQLQLGSEFYFEVGGTLKIAFPSGMTTENVQDIVAAMMTSGGNTSWVYDDLLGTLRVDSVQLTDEEVQDKVAALILQGANTTVTYNDGANTLTIAETAAGKTSEEIMDLVAALLQQGSNVSLTYNDGGDTLTIAATAGASSLIGTIATATYTTASIADTVSETGTVNLAKSFQLIKVVASVASRVRVYNTAANRTADTARAIGVLPTGQHGLIQESVLTSVSLTDDTMPKPFGINQEAVRSSAIPISIQNRSGITQTVTITFTYLILEA